MRMDYLGGFDKDILDMRYVLLFQFWKAGRVLWHNTFYKRSFASFYLINYPFKVAKLNITESEASVGKGHNPHLSHWSRTN